MLTVNAHLLNGTVYNGTLFHIDILQLKVLFLLLGKEKKKKFELFSFKNRLIMQAQNSMISQQILAQVIS